MDLVHKKLYRDTQKRYELLMKPSKLARSERDEIMKNYKIINICLLKFMISHK
jgi:hypothetical protein